MAGRRTNLALFGLLGVALATGVLAFAMGSEWGRWAVVAHALAGIGIVVLGPWKSAIARRGLRRARPDTWASVAFTAFVAVTLLTGFLHATGLVLSVAGVRLLIVHVGAALLSIPLAAAHVLARRVRPHRTDLSRRALLRAGAVVGGSAVAYAAVEGLVGTAGLPGGDRRFTGSHEAGSFDPDRMPVTQWLDDRVPEIDPQRWLLSMVQADGSTASLTLDDLAGFDDHVRATIDCTGGWFAEQHWEGVWLARLLEGLGEARSIGVGSATGYGRRYPVRDASRLLLATRAGGRPLSAGHGFPARLVAPGRRGFWWVKWVDSIELSATPWWWQSPFPLT
jgi:Oxidoreductase molybdopterin binding domain